LYSKYWQWNSWFILLLIPLHSVHPKLLAKLIVLIQFPLQRLAGNGNMLNLTKDQGKLWRLLCTSSLAWKRLWASFGPQEIPALATGYLLSACPQQERQMEVIERIGLLSDIDPHRSTVEAASSLKFLIFLFYHTNWCCVLLEN
jgi:hypothetical protein